MTTDQHQIFLTDEGDACRRNAAALTATDQPDATLGMVTGLSKDWRISITSVGEVGCANGWRLPRPAKRLSGPKRLAGFDVRAAAIAEGHRLRPEFDLEVGLAQSPPFAGKFDLMIVSFVLHRMDRSNLATAIATVDGSVCSGGCLVIAGFLPVGPMDRIYHHRRDVALFIYKQGYAATFLVLAFCREIARSTFPHDHGGTGHTPRSNQGQAMCLVVHKPEDAYHEQ